MNNIKYEKVKIVYNELISNYKNYKAREIIKFKDITSMDWMIKNQLYLLKCKLMANEYIDINLKSLETFIINLIKTSMNSGELSIIEKQVIILLFKIKKVQCNGFIDDILLFLISKFAINTQIDFKNNGIKEMFKIFLNDLSYPIPIYQSTLEFVIRTQNNNNSLIILLDLILNSNSSSTLSNQSKEILINYIKFKRYEINNNNFNYYISGDNDNDNNNNNNNKINKFIEIDYKDLILKILENHKLSLDEIKSKIVPNYYFDSLLELSISRYDINEIINLIQNFINEINIDNHKQTSITVNNLYQLLLNIDGIKLEIIQNVRKLLSDHAIIINHSLCHTFWYLAIKSPFLIRYLLKRETQGFARKRKFEESDQRNDYDRGSNQLFDGEVLIGRYINNSGHLKSGIILDYRKLTFDFIFNSDDGDDDDNFDSLLLELMKQCTHDTFGVDRKSSVWSMSQDLFYLVSDLNCNHLFNVEIQYYLDNYYTGNEWKLWTTLVSNGFRCDLLLKQFNLKRFQSTFKKDNILSVGEIISWFHLIFSSGNVDAIKAIFQNYYHFQGKYSFHFDLIQLETVKYLFTHYYNFFVPSFEEISKSSINFFTESFIRGDILMCDLFLKFYPFQFKITNDLISSAINKNKTNIIKYYCENGIIKSNNQLDHLNNQLKINNLNF
ncbi:hypothetical protein DDB_G0293598 [Dictyostelium discoideum AX4]|uniref:Uncharacterized protein n=1 Tax=Dictyostelium discoideum TaxID=44689 RepID=Q54BJ3_DICDI|nr:hypothetical protein DDB_G0293598 [Dictyostelium discoideum AX4]EAL60611.1 hypothetical protein DDB_G0293598 [Dictyostelium discoideum AX4]|eukprot:XP_629036.1 hypothetical protein DDB_G0293598 [Dictyostelium discoideum AX4]